MLSEIQKPSSAYRRAQASSTARGVKSIGETLRAREAEHALGDDVALDLARASGDRRAEAAEVLDRPGPLTPHRRTELVEVERVETERLGAEQQGPLQRLAAVQLEERVLGRGFALQELRESAVADRHQRLRVDVEAGHRVSEVRTLAERTTVGPF